MQYSLSRSELEEPWGDQKMRKIAKRLEVGPFVSFLGRKIAFLLLTLFIAMNFIFIFPRLMPSNPADLMIARITIGQTTTVGGGSTGGGKASLEVLREIYIKKFGVYEPLHVQYIAFWRRFFTMDFGVSYWAYPQSVSSLIMCSLPWTLALVVPVLLCGFVIGNWVGSRAAYRRGRFDKIIYYISLYMFQAPYYWFAMILLFVFAAKLKWFPIYGAYSLGWVRPVLSLDWFLDAVYHYILPFLSLLGVGVGGWAIGMRAMTLYEMESDYIQYSKQLGFTKGKLMEYAKHNAILPNFTWIPITLAMLVSQTLLVEIVFGYPGLGTLLYNAVFALDYPLMEAIFVIVVMIVLVGNFLTDLLYGKIDPRISTGYVGGK
jgi:peptide/nickel transport system permease protein